MKKKFKTLSEEEYYTTIGAGLNPIRHDCSFITLEINPKGTEANCAIKGKKFRGCVDCKDFDKLIGNTKTKLDYAIETLGNRIKDWQGSMQYDNEETIKEVIMPRIKQLENAIKILMEHME